MSEEKPKRRGRPPSDKTSGETGRATFHLGLRLNDHRRDQLLALVEDRNRRAVAAGIPPAVSASSLVALWIGERLDLETSKLTKGKR
jgi:hypothetical protein